MYFQNIVLVCIVVLGYAYANSKSDFKRNAAEPPRAVQLSEDVVTNVTEASYNCIDNYNLIPCYFNRIKGGKYFCSQSFQYFVFCVLTDERNDYADKDTGLWKPKHIAKIFPKECKIYELTTYCNEKVEKMNITDRVEKYFEGYKCFQDDTMCDPDLPTKAM